MRMLTMLLVCAGLLGASEEKSQSYWVALVSKGTTYDYYARMVDRSHHLVVSPTPVGDALVQERVNIDSDQSLYIIEPQDPKLPLNGGDLFKMGRFILTTRTVNHDGHIHDMNNPNNHVVKVDGTLKHYRPSVRKTRLNLSRAPLVDLVMTKEYLEEKLRQLSGADPFQRNGQNVTIRERGSSSGRGQARDFLRQEYEAMGFTVSEHDYGRGVNLIAEKSGFSGKWLLVTAHYDSVRNAGADDDGAGTISAMAIADALADKSLTHGLRIVAFDQEENGLVGSAAYARELSQQGRLEEIIGVINIEMTGYDGDQDGAFHAIDCNENTSADLTAAVEAAVDALNLPIHKTAACTNRSDHASFWRYDVPAIVVSQNFFGGDSNPCYHRSCDTVAKVDYQYMLNVTQAMSAAAAQIVEAR